MARILTLTLNPALDLTVRLQSLQPGALNRSLGQSSHAAGKGLNVAQVLADLGHKVTVGGSEASTTNSGTCSPRPCRYPSSQR